MMVTEINEKDASKTQNTVPAEREFAVISNKNKVETKFFLNLVYFTNHQLWT